jgi:hypothetical protein
MPTICELRRESQGVDFANDDDDDDDDDDEFGPSSAAPYAVSLARLVPLSWCAKLLAVNVADNAIRIFQHEDWTLTQNYSSFNKSRIAGGLRRAGYGCQIFSNSIPPNLAVGSQRSKSALHLWLIDGSEATGKKSKRVCLSLQTPGLMLFLRRHLLVLILVSLLSLHRPRKRALLSPNEDRPNHHQQQQPLSPRLVRSNNQPCQGLEPQLPLVAPYV